MTDLSRSIARAKPRREVLVSTHAVRRYVERVLGFEFDIEDDRLAVAGMRALGLDIERVEREILAAVGPAPLFGDGTVRKRDIRMLFRGGAVRTVLCVVDGEKWRGAAGESRDWTPRSPCLHFEQKLARGTR